MIKNRLVSQAQARLKVKEGDEKQDWTIWLCKWMQAQVPELEKEPEPVLSAKGAKDLQE